MSQRFGMAERATFLEGRCVRDGAGGIVLRSRARLFAMKSTDMAALWIERVPREQERRGDLKVVDSRRLSREIAPALVSLLGRPETAVIVRRNAVAESVFQLASPGPVWCSRLDSRAHVGLLCENIS